MSDGLRDPDSARHREAACRRLLAENARLRGLLLEAGVVLLLGIAHNEAPQGDEILDLIERMTE